MNFSTTLAELAIARQLDINRYSGNLQNDMLRLMRDLSLDIEAALSGDLTDFNKRRMNEFLREIRILVAETYGTARELLDSELRELAEIESTWAQTSTNQAAGFALMASLPTAAAIERLARDVVIEAVPLDDWMKRQELDTSFRINQAIRSGVALGKTNGQIMKSLRNLQVKNLGDKEAMAITSRNLNSLVRTAVQDVAIGSAVKTFEANAAVIKGVVHLSTLDGRTSDVCIGRSGLQWSFPDYKPVGHKIPFQRPPLHFSCRSKITPVTKSYRELGLDIDDVPESTRASMDGQVPAGFTFSDFLEKKGKAFQDDVLGPGKAQLWRDGKINLTQLLDQTGNPLTLAELRKKYD